jgi:DNA invertase Pin-like site-specific DNA recombinase
MFFHIMGALAQFERVLIRERTLAGLTAARAQGRFKAKTGIEVRVVAGV